MNTSAKISLIALIVVVVFSGIWVVNAYSKITDNPTKVMDPEYAADFSDDRVLVGASHNIFVGKVLEQTGTKERGIGPETQFSVQVVENVKGTLQGTVTIDQQGGYKNGTLYIVGDETTKPQDGNSTLLKSGSTYLFVTRYNPEENWYTLNPYPTASKVLSTDASLSTSALKKIAENDSRFQAMKAAYPNEILLKADVLHNNTLNSYTTIRSSENAQSTSQ